MKAVLDFLRKDRKSDKSRGLYLTTVIMIVGLIAIVVTTYSMDPVHKEVSDGADKCFTANFGLAVVVGCASILSGAFLGFLFGIPRSLQRTQFTTGASSDTTITTSNFTDNTNLEQISDWLTKIIVGVSLTQLPQIQMHFAHIVDVIAKGFCGDHFLNRAFASAIVIFYSISGFIFSYLWTRINLKEALNGLEKLKSDVDENKSNLDAIKKAQLEKERMKIRNDEKPYSDILAIAKPEAVSEYNDPQKKRWGGKSEANDRKITVKVVPHEGDTEFDVTLTVESTNGNKPLTGNVYFFLHDSYPGSVEVVTAENNKAILQLESYEAFTVGAVCDDGNTKLELDINQAPGIPAEYKYLV